MRLTTVACLLLVLPAGLLGDDTRSQREVAREFRGAASNVQFNRDGSVRFVRFSKSIVRDEHLAKLQSFPSLDYLAVVTPTVTDAGFAHVGGLRKLDTLYLSRSALTDAGAVHLRDLPKLERLYLDGTAITDAALDHVAKLETLTTLALRRTAITDEGLSRVAELNRLEVLLLGGTKATDAGLATLSSLPELRVLHLDRTAIDGSGLEALAALPKLEELSLIGTKVDADGLRSLAGAKSLRRILLAETTFTPDERTALRGALPKVALHFPPLPGEERGALERFLAGEPLRRPAAEERTIVEPGPLVSPASERFAAGDDVPDFQRHVVPLLGRLGCNGRSCHGSFQGKGGFRLSMFGYDFAADHEALTAGDEPRVDVDDPDASLILEKPTDDLAHGGGKRFEKDGWEHALLRRWIATGAAAPPERPHELVEFETEPAEIVFPRIDADEPIRLRAFATWSDGTREEVTPLVRFQSNDESVAEVDANGLVRSTGSGDTHVVAYYDNGVKAVPVLRPVSDRVDENYPNVPTPTRIDELVTAKLSKLGIVPSDLCTDEEFLRRVSLDLAGTLPTPDEVRAFLADGSPDKRARKVDELLETPAYVEWWTMHLADLTGCNSQYLGTTDMNSPAAGQWVDWLRRRVRDNAGWDEIAAGILLATSRRPGRTYESYASEQSRFMARTDPADFAARENPLHYYWFRSNNTSPEERALSFGYAFLGVRLQCAQCHKHPFDRWSREDFGRFSNFFTRIERGIAPDARESQRLLKEKLGVPTKLDTAALRRQMYIRVSAEGLPIPWNEIWIEPPGSKPLPGRVLGGPDVDLNEYADPREPLVAWLVDPENPYFARAFVNRIWARHFGRGIVEPADDFNVANPPANGPLLDWLAAEFVAHDFDVKWLHRTILTSDAYQRSRLPNETNLTDDRHFSRARVRRLPAEVTIDAILQATAGDKGNAGYLTNVAPRKIGQHPRSIQARGIDYSLLVFGKPLRTTNCDCERQVTPTLMQSLFLRNDTELVGWLERPDGWIAEVSRATDRTNDDLIATAYLRTLSREPTTAERARSRAYLDETDEPAEGLRDLVWALVNTREFRTNH